MSRSKAKTWSQLKYVTIAHVSSIVLYKYSCKPKESSVDASDNCAYTRFCDTEIKQRLISAGEIMYMSKLYNSFIEENEKQGSSETAVSKRTLKKWLQRDFPQLTFIRPKQKTFSEIVICEKSIPVLLQEVAPEHAEESSDSESDDEDHDVPSCGRGVHFDHEQRQMMYMSGLVIRNTIADLSVHKKDKYWPLTAENTNLEKAEEIVPTSLFNLLAWCTNSSEKAEFEKYVSVSEDKKRKLLSIAQDIMFLY